MAEVKTFRVKRDERKPIQFNLAFERTREDGSTDEVVEKFHARPSIPGMRLLNVAASMTGEGGEQAAALRDFLTDAVVADDKDRWVKTLNDPDNIVDNDIIAEISEWLMEQYGSNPTDTASSSQDGQ